MKKITIYGLCSLFLFSIIQTSIFAAKTENSENDDTAKIAKIEQSIEENFSSYNDNDKVLETDDGGFLSGPGTVEVYEITGTTKTLKTTYNVETDPNSITVKEAKEKMFEEAKENLDNPIQLLASITVPSAKDLYVLNFGDKYTSNIFSAKGWRFSGHMFICSDTAHGTALRWKTFVDGGRVGIPDDFAKLGNGGYPIYPSEPYWIDVGFYPTAYWTYNPIYGTHYEVANINA